MPNESTTEPTKHTKKPAAPKLNKYQKQWLKVTVLREKLEGQMEDIEKSITETFEQLISTKWEEVDRTRAELSEAIEEIRDDIQETYDDYSDTWQEGDRGEAMKGVIDSLESISSALDEVVEPDIADFNIDMPDISNCFEEEPDFSDL